MRCKHCGEKFPDKNKYCPNCGTKVEREDEEIEESLCEDSKLETSAKCIVKEIGKVMKKCFLYIWNGLKKYIPKAWIALKNKWKKLSSFGKLMTILFSVCIILGLTAWAKEKTLAIVLCILQIGALVAACLVRKGTAKTSEDPLSAFLPVIAIVLFIPICLILKPEKKVEPQARVATTYSFSQETPREDEKELEPDYIAVPTDTPASTDTPLPTDTPQPTYTPTPKPTATPAPTATPMKKLSWPKGKLAALLPAPECPYGEVVKADDSIVYVNVYSVTRKYYEEYVQVCREAGFSQNGEEKSSQYAAKDKQGNGLLLQYDEEKEIMVIGILEPACAVQLYLNCTANLFFSTYDIDIYIDGKKADTLSHGKSKTVVWEMYKGAHTITVTKKENTSINGSATFTVTEDVKISYKIYCYSDRVDIQEESVESMRPLKQNEAKIPASSEEYGKMSFDEVSEQLKSAGFTNINGTVIRDLTGAWSEPGEGQIEKITIGGRANFSKYEIFNKDIEIKITYHEKILEKEELERRFSANRYESAEKTLADFENTGYTLIYMIDGKMTTNFSAEGLFFESGEVNTEERTVRLYFVSAEKREKYDALEKEIPFETAKKIAVVALTNGLASDVFKSDRETLDKSKFHSYKDISGFYLSVYEEGEWSMQDEKTWKVKDIICWISGYGTMVRASMNITKEGENYVVFNVDRTIGNEDNIHSDDRNKVTFEHWEPSEQNLFLTVSPSLVKQDRNKAEENDRNNRTLPTKARTEWKRSVIGLFDITGRVSAMDNAIKARLNDESSYRHKKTSCLEVMSNELCDASNEALKKSGISDRLKVGDILIITEYTAKNLFNATLKKTAIGIIRYGTTDLIVRDVK